MFGPPKDVEGECNARLYLSDDYGDALCTIRCKLKPGHEGKHSEFFERRGLVTIEWDHDESIVCVKCGRRDEHINPYDLDVDLCYKCEEKYCYQGDKAVGVVYSSPYPKDSYQDILWRKGWEDGNLLRKLGFKK